MKELLLFQNIQWTSYETMLALDWERGKIINKPINKPSFLNIQSDLKQHLLCVVATAVQYELNNWTKQCKFPVNFLYLLTRCSMCLYQNP